MPNIIDILTQAGDWDLKEQSIIDTIEHVTNRLCKEDIEVSIVLTNDIEIQKLNKQYRGKDKPTNVLSFEQELPILGDIVLAYETIKKESKEQNKSFKAHFTHLLIHGLLHLLGFDHQAQQDADKMEGLEIELLKELDIDNPYL